MDPRRKNPFTDESLFEATTIGASLLAASQKIHDAYLRACEEAAKQLVLEGCDPRRVRLAGEGPLIENFTDGAGWLRIRVAVVFEGLTGCVQTSQFKPGQRRLFTPG